MHEQFANKGDALGRLVEECMEVCLAAGKTVRFGYDSVNPLLPVERQETNEDWLKREIADLEAAIASFKAYRKWKTYR